MIRRHSITSEGSGDPEEQTARFGGLQQAVAAYRLSPAHLKLVKDEWLAASCPIIELKQLREIRALTATAAQLVLVMSIEQDSPPRNVLRIVKAMRAHVPYLPIALLSTESRSSVTAELLELGHADALIWTRQDADTARATFFNLLRRYAVQQQTAHDVEQLKERSVRDGLTGLYNHAYLLDQLEREFARSSRTGEPLSCVMLDLDHFKAINDTYGHRYGDYVLAEVSNLLKRSLRVSDIVGRYGGEEFLLLLPATDSREAHSVAEKLRGTLEGHTFRSGEIQTIVTASFGVASNHDEGIQSWEQLLVLTDRTLYFAKENGRNCVCAAAEHASMSEFDVFRRRLRLNDESAPVLLFLSTDPVAREVFVKLTDAERYQMVCFERPTDFFSSFEAFAPEVVIVDAETEGVSFDWFRQFSTRAQQLQMPIVVVGEKEKFLLEPRFIELSDLSLPKGLPLSAYRKYLLLLLAENALRNEVRRLTKDILITQKRIIRHERMRTIGELAAGLAQQITNVFAAISMYSRKFMERATKLDEELEMICSVEKLAERGLATLGRFQRQLQAGQNRELVLISLTDLVSSSLRLAHSWWLDDTHTWAQRFRFSNKVPTDTQVLVSRDEMVTTLAGAIINQLEMMPDGGTVTFLSEDRVDNVTLLILASPKEAEVEGNNLPGLDPAGPVEGKFAQSSNIPDPTIGPSPFQKLLRHAEFSFVRAGAEDNEPTLRLRDTASKSGTSIRGKTPCTRLRRILVIDSDDACRALCVELFQELGHQASGWPSVQLAWEDFRTHSVDWDLVLADVPLYSSSELALFRDFIYAVGCPTTYILTSWGISNSEMRSALPIVDILQKPLTRKDAERVLGETRPFK